MDHRITTHSLDLSCKISDLAQIFTATCTFIAGKHMCLQQNKADDGLNTLIFLLYQQLLLKLPCHYFGCAAANWLDACFHAALKTGFEVYLVLVWLLLEHLSDCARAQVCAV